MPGGKHLLGMPQGKHVFGTAKVGERGQIVIPKEARLVFNIEPGDSLLILGDEKTGLVITKADVLNEIALRILQEARNER